MNLYGYANGDPVNYADPFGLYADRQGEDSADDESLDDDSPCGDEGGAEGCTSTTERIVDFSAGLGDALLFGTGPMLRRAFGIEGVNRCSSAYSTGATTALVAGTARMGYAVAAKAVSALAATPTAAAAGRETLKQIFRLGLGKGYRSVDASRYATGQALREAAGRTNPMINSYGGGVAVAGAAGASGGSCS